MAAAHTWGGDIDLVSVQVVPQSTPIHQKPICSKVSEAGENIAVGEEDLLRWSVTCLEVAGASTGHAESQVFWSCVYQQMSLCSTEFKIVLRGKTAAGCRQTWPLQPWLQQARGVCEGYPKWGLLS